MSKKPDDEICFVLKFIIFVIIFVVGIILTVVLLLAVFSAVRVSIEDATLSRFVVTASPMSVSYNFTIVLQIHNPNLNIGIYYDSLEASYLFNDQIFAWTTLPTFYQHPRGTTVLRPVIEGNSVVPHLTGVSAVGDGLLRSNETNVFGLEVQLGALVRYKRHHNQCRLEVKCPMSGLVVTQSSTDNTFKRVKCDVERKPGFFC